MTTTDPNLMSAGYAIVTAVLYVPAIWLFLGRETSAEARALRRAWLLVPLVFPGIFLLFFVGSTVLELVVKAEWDTLVGVVAWGGAFCINFAAGIFLARQNKRMALTPLRVARAAMASAMLSLVHISILSFGALVMETGDVGETLINGFWLLVFVIPIYTVVVALGGVLSAGLVWLYHAVAKQPPLGPS